MKHKSKKIKNNTILSLISTTSFKETFFFRMEYDKISSTRGKQNTSKQEK